MHKYLIFIQGYKHSILLVANMFIGFIGAYFIYRSFFRFRLIDSPNKRSSHSHSVPRGAGIGILLAFMLSGIVLRIATTMTYAVIIIGFVSFYEDHFPTPITFRLIVQFVTAVIFLFPYIIAINDNLWKALITLVLIIIYMIGTTNMFNFMDGINGISGITAIIGFGLLWYNANNIDNNVNVNNESLTIIAACVAMSCLGFLPLNFPKAKIFLGDVGSITLGFLFAGLVVYFSKSAFDLLCYSGFIIPFYMDETLSVLIRIRRNKNLFIPHRVHLYQLLANEMRIPHWKISLGYGFVQAFIGIIIILLKPEGYVPIIMIWVGSFIGITMLYQLICKKKGLFDVTRGQA